MYLLGEVLNIEVSKIFLVLNDPNNLFFTVCLIVCLGVLLIEIIALIVGFSSHWLDSTISDLVDFDVPDSNFANITGWLHLGRIPFLIWLSIFFLGWGTTGLVLQSLLDQFFGVNFISIVAVPIALFINFFVVHFVCRLINPLIPKDETQAINLNQLIGLTGKVTIGTCAKGSPAEILVKDGFGTMHYLMVEPEHDDDVFIKNQEVILYDRKNGLFTVISKDSLKSY